MIRKRNVLYVASVRTLRPIFTHCGSGDPGAAGHVCRGLQRERDTREGRSEANCDAESSEKTARDDIRP